MTNDKVERKDEEGMERIASGENTPWTTPVLGRQFDGFAVKGGYISFADFVRDPAGFSAALQFLSRALGFGGRDVREPAGRIGNSAKEIYGSFRHKAFNN